MKFWVSYLRVLFEAASLAAFGCLVPSSLVCCAQAGTGLRPANAVSARWREEARGEAVREIDDLSTGQRWFLFRNAAHPGGPGRLVADRAAIPKPRGNAARGGIRPRPAIRTGDQVDLEQKTPVVEAHLEGVALGPAYAGDTLRVRLRLGGRVMTAQAIAPGRVELLSPGEGRP